MIPYGKQSISSADINAVVRALQSDFLTTGPEVEAFEAEFAAVVGAEHAVAVSNATAALHLAMRVLDIGPGQRVVTAPNTFLASANAAAFVGAIPDFCDIDKASHTLDPALLEQQWKDDTTAVVAVDYAGHPCHLPEIARVARNNGAYVVEDACHGVGGGFSHDGNYWKLGGHPWADITTFSFHPVKTMTTGEGGMLVTNRADWAHEARKLRSHGVTRDSTNFQGLCDDPHKEGCEALDETGPWYYEMQSLGYNYRLTDLQCALGRSQLSRLPGFIERRQDLVARYNEAFNGLPGVDIPAIAPWLAKEAEKASKKATTTISWHLYTVEVDFKGLKRTRSEVMQALRNRGIGSQVLYIPVHLQPYYRKTFGYRRGKCPQSEIFYERTLSLPLYPDLSNEDQDKVIDAFKEALQ